jgi:DNA integrity scanning protein DisA with diadenylate cyclase activity
MDGSTLEAITGVFSLSEITPREVLDVAIVCFLLYQLFRFVRGTQATHIVLGALGVVALFLVGTLLELRLLTMLGQPELGLLAIRFDQTLDVLFQGF